MSRLSSRIQKQRVIPVFRGGKRPCSGAGTRPRKDRNPVPEAVDAGLAAFVVFSRRELGIHCSGPNLDSGICRVVQYRPSTRAGDREKTGMTVFTAVYKGRRNALIQVYFVCFFLITTRHFGCAAGASSSGRSPGRSADLYFKAVLKSYVISMGARPYGHKNPHTVRL